MNKKAISLIIMLSSFSLTGHAQAINHDENKVPDYKLPELLKTKDGKVISSAEDWKNLRRPEILSLFKEHMYGKIPATLQISSWKIIEQDQNALNGNAIRKQVLLTFQNNGKQLDVNLLIYLPKAVEKAPVFVGYNFYGNHTVTSEPEVIIPKSWSLNNEDIGVTDHIPNAKSRGKMKRRWAVDKIIEGGYGLATIFYGDVDPDRYAESGIDFSDGVHPLLYKKGQTNPNPDEWGAISAWAWGLSRAMDYFEKDPEIDQDKVIVMGHSRLGKTSLWAGALDERFAVVISNNSGSGGAALSRNKRGERVPDMNSNFTHWFADNLSNYEDEDDLPVDQHMLIALMAPRPVYIASAVDDQWADPEGEYLSGYFATPVYELFGKKGLTSAEMPPLNQPVMNTIGYHIRSGGHDVTDFDWEQFIRFSDLHLKP